nr:hypothetical protein [Streptococcus urinalis]
MVSSDIVCPCSVPVELELLSLDVLLTDVSLADVGSEGLLLDSALAVARLHMMAATDNTAATLLYFLIFFSLTLYP